MENFESKVNESNSDLDDFKEQWKSFQERCPHCGVAKPTYGTGATLRHEEFVYWEVQLCNSCQGLVAKHILDFGQVDVGQPDIKVIVDVLPKIKLIHESIPARSAAYLKQAIDSKKIPSGCVMLCASAIDAMLKERGFRPLHKNDHLIHRIDRAAEQHLLTIEMAGWAHHVRAVANDERHADGSADLPTQEEAQNSLDFAFALAEFLFVLPSKVTKGLKR